MMEALEATLPYSAVLVAELDADGFAVVPGLLDAATCAALAAGYDDEPAFRSRVVMARHGFGRGEYRYYANPLPDAVAALRRAAYDRLQPVANGWNAALGIDTRYPATLDSWLRRCHAGGQQRSTPLLLKYEPDDYNCLHQDMYGPLVFPLQLTVLLSRPGTDFQGGEFVLTEQRPRRQSRAAVVPLAQGDAVIFPVNHRPVAGTRGAYRATMRHGVSRVRSGRRFSLGIILHDAT